MCLSILAGTQSRDAVIDDGVQLILSPHAEIAYNAAAFH